IWGTTEAEEWLNVTIWVPAFTLRALFALLPSYGPRRLQTPGTCADLALCATFNNQPNSCCYV
ncbi:MAG: hypothetical protein M3380_00725, partial [Chloroflexota bacterium]|nr:hypothetical protein [Chloroflexota bacterium]